jgi:hypothetical protein
MANKEYLKERREWLHEHYFCVDCKKQDAHTLIGRYRCYDCTEKIRVRKSGIKYTRQEREDLGLCSICSNVVKDGYKVCEKCYERMLKAQRISHINHTPRPPIDRLSNPQIPTEEWAENGFCRTCGDKAMDGYKVCESCRQHLINIRIRQKELGKDTFWRNTMNFSNNFSETY